MCSRQIWFKDPKYGESAFEELDEIFYIVQPNTIFNIDILNMNKNYPYVRLIALPIKVSNWNKLQKMQNQKQAGEMVFCVFHNRTDTKLYP